jgi:transposase
MIISGDDPVSRGAQRFEVFTGAGKRRDWPPEMKVSIVAECYAEREGVSAVARRHGLDPSQVYQCRRARICRYRHDQRAA